jgi:hypothetical protein
VGECIPTRISEGLQASQYVILILSPRSCSSNWVDREWKAKYWEEVSHNQVLILPVLLEDCDIPELLKPKRYADFRRDYAAGLQELLDALNPSRPNGAAGQNAQNRGSEMPIGVEPINARVLPALNTLLATELETLLDEDAREALASLRKVASSRLSPGQANAFIRNALIISRQCLRYRT